MRFGFIVMAALSALVALSSFRYVGALDNVWLDVDPGVRSVVLARPVEALTHMLVAPIALLIGPIQFLPELRRTHLAVHRGCGRVYVLACGIAGVGGFVTAFHASGGPVAGFGFGLLAVLWVATTLGALWAVLARNVLLHRVLMRFSYAMTFGAVTLRLQIPFGFMLGCRTYSAMSVWLAYTAWIPNVVVVALYSLTKHRFGALRTTASLEG